jgi:hypothetical protein
MDREFRRARSGASFILLGLLIALRAASAQELVGTWKLISETVQRRDQADQPFGASPLGTMIFDPSGHVAMIISRPDLPRIQANRRDAGTPGEQSCPCGNARLLRDVQGQRSRRVAYHSCRSQRLP